jgi:hypothetical protein
MDLQECFLEYGTLFSTVPFLKMIVMPNSANKSNNNRGSGKGQPKDRVSDRSSSQPNPERSDLKQGRNDQDQGSTDRTSNQGRKQASGGDANA